ncbi:beta-4C adrenergic receptor-like [Liolophura sinensis]|uniref:beta-4C adrenergic receptor-like n=1 Tax=Liolophura sinensis TaxID=3198878 RepID=UPI003158405D
MSIWSLALVSVDRYIAILYPLRYMALMTEKRTCGIICALWLLDIILYTSPMMASPGFLYYQYSPKEAICGLYWGFRAFCYFTAGCVPVLSGTVIVFTNFRVFQSVLRLRRAVNALPSQNPPATNQPAVTSTKSFKAVKVLLLTSVTYFLMWGPYVVVNVFMMPFYPELAFSSGLLFSVMWLANSNSFINVVIYSCFYRGFRSRAWRLIVTCCGMRSERRVASTQRPESMDIDTLT